MADKSHTAKPMELPAELADWRAVLRHLHGDGEPAGGIAHIEVSKPQPAPTDASFLGPILHGKPDAHQVHVSAVMVGKPKDGKGEKPKAKHSVEPSALEADGSPLRAMVLAMRKATAKKPE